ncbi:hypothetical protein [Streptomyces cremeus]|uniref:HTH araC/xylS-type domain-containing protein n=1 Tax=Streptomyces cremeus TaxID=66881 RepID=A0ABV5PKF4_STRCM
MSRILAHYRETAPEEAASLDESTGTPLGATSLDQANKFFAEQMSRQERRPPETRRQVPLSAVNALIEDNPSSNLTPGAVAARIRRRRLARCHQDLVAPGLSVLPVYAAGARWGLTSAGFNGPFRASYGMDPGSIEAWRCRTEPCPYRPPHAMTTTPAHHGNDRTPPMPERGARHIERD